MDKESRLEKLGEKLKKLRKEKGLSLKEVGEKVDLSHNFLSEVERGKKEPSKEHIRQLAKLYKVNEDVFFTTIKKLPLRTEEILDDNPDLQILLSEAQRKFGDNPEKIDTLKEGLTKLFLDLSDD